MKNQDVVRELTRQGILVTPEILKKVRDGGFGGKEIQQSPSPLPKKTKLSVKIKKPITEKKMSPEDFVAYYNTRYMGLRNILLKKTDALSINKAKHGFSEVSVIGMVGEKTAQGFVLEDATGNISVVSREDVRKDDVVGVGGVVREGKLFQKEIVWPDVPATNKPTTIPGLKLLFTTFFNDAIIDSLGEFSLVFAPGADGSGVAEPDKLKVVSDITSPCFATIKKDGSEFVVLVYKPKNPPTSEDAVSLLKRRHLMPGVDEVLSATDQHMIEPVPDIFWVISNQRGIETYNGVTVIISKEHDAVRFDAEIGEAHFAHETLVRGGL